jgi:hypothetical protein
MPLQGDGGNQTMVSHPRHRTRALRENTPHSLGSTSSTTPAETEVVVALNVQGSPWLEVRLEARTGNDEHNSWIVR